MKKIFNILFVLTMTLTMFSCKNVNTQESVSNVDSCAVCTVDSCSVDTIVGDTVIVEESAVSVE